jgi:hypothetical protein
VTVVLVVLLPVKRYIIYIEPRHHYIGQHKIS